MFQDVIKALGVTEGDTNTIPKSDVARWMMSDDPQVMGAVYRLISRAKHISRISPPLSFDEAFAFFMRYFEFCLRNNPKRDWVDDRFAAGYNLVSAFVTFWDDGQDKKYFVEMKSLLSRLYIDGPVALQNCIEQGIVEHLFERRDIREFFSDWQNNPALRPAYEAGKEWADSGGRSPLTQR